jgi:hypothetical protein
MAAAGVATKALQLHGQLVWSLAQGWFERDHSIAQGHDVEGFGGCVMPNQSVKGPSLVGK